MTDRAAHETLMRALIDELWNAADISTIAKFFTDDCVMHRLGEASRGGEEHRGRDAFRDTYIGPVLRDFPGLRHEIKDLVIDGERVVMRFWGACDVPPEQIGGRLGKHLRYEGMAQFRMQGGRIDELWVQTNWDRVMAALNA